MLRQTMQASMTNMKKTDSKAMQCLGILGAFWENGTIQVFGSHGEA